MSFAFGGFGANNNNNNNQQPQNTGFGGFGSNNNNNTSGTGFGQQQQNTGFGGNSNPTGGSLFGNTSGSFGSGGSGFGSSSSTPFGGNKPAFGSTTTTAGGLFGSTTATTGGTGFGGFGTNNTTTNSASPFGTNNSNSSGGGLFGNPSKPAFGTGTTTGGSLFGGGSSGNAFGPNNNQTGGAFGAPQGTALGGNTAECQGTGSTPFQAWTEKDGPGSAQTNHFQSITFMPPYQKYSFEELRLADYNQGRRYGNGNGQAGAFGASTGFGGFGQSSTQNPTPGFGAAATTTGTGMFGAAPSSGSSPFGATQTPGGFGGNTSGGLFGTQKPAVGGLFGSTTTSTPQQSGGLFGSTGQTGFGTQPNTGFGAATTGSSLFGNNTQQAQKPAFSFGTSTTGNASTTGFGATGGFGTNTSTAGSTGGPFGSSQGSSVFGAQQPQQPGASNPFGQQNQNQPAFGGFGSNSQSKPGGLFGTGSSAAPGGGLFANTAQNNAQQPGSTNNLFGGANNQSNGSSLFGAKPAGTSTGGSLFGNNNTNNTNNAGGGLFSGSFGNNNSGQQNQGGGLFGASNQQQKPGGLFGSTGTNGGGGLFGNNQQQSSGSSLFGTVGNNQNQPQQGASLFGNNPNNSTSSLFGDTQQNALQPPQAMTASILDRNPYGSSSIFSGLPPPPQASPGPIATPISAGYKVKRNAVLPQYKINPNMASRLVTPQKRGYGFSYSTYGTPSSISSNASTPGGLGSSLLGSSIGRGLGKSFSTSNLRRTFDNDADSLLSPGAFSAGSSRYSGSGSLKRLTIDRSLRTDLFGNQAVAALPSPDKVDQSRQPGILKKKVSFDTSTVGGNGEAAEANTTTNATIPTSDSSATPSAQEQGFLRSSNRGNGRYNGPRTNIAPAQSEKEQVKGNELAIVHEDGTPESSSALNPPQDRARTDRVDPEPGQYYMRPSREELRKMPREQLKKVSGFTIGRERCGHVVFDQPVDLTTVDLDNIYDNIAVINIRSLTVYPNNERKPPLGKGLNVPSTITLENSWPRQRDRKSPSFEKSGSRFNKHVDRLRKVGGTEFVKYDEETGEWVFKVPHFTTYALDFDDTGSEGDSLHTSALSAPPDTPTPKSRTPKARYTPMPTYSVQESSIATDDESRLSSGPDDTFGSKKQKMPPGAFDGGATFEEEGEMEEVQRNGESFLEERSAVSPSENGVDEPSEQLDDLGRIDDQSLMIQDDEMGMAGSYPQPPGKDMNPLHEQSLFRPKSILKASQQQSLLGLSTPGKLGTDVNDDWAKCLQRTISPRKQDRQALRESQANIFREMDVDSEVTPRIASPNKGEKGFATSIDLMNSLFGQEEARKSGRGIKQGAKAKGFEWPYTKKSNFNQPEMNELDQEFHESYKPTWGPENTLLYAMPSRLGSVQDKYAQKHSVLNDIKGTFVSEGRDIRFAKFVKAPHIITESLVTQRATCIIIMEHGVPFAEAQSTPFRDFIPGVPQEARQERFAWELAGILFDKYDDEVSGEVPAAQSSIFQERILKDRLLLFWANICQEQAHRAVATAPSTEERALAYLSAHKVIEACEVLLEGKDFRLAMLVAQLGGDRIMHDDMATQIKEWRRLNVLSEMTEPVRALYELLSGNTCLCEGKKGPLEDRATTFVTSERFNLDWKRAFGLMLWYGILAEDPIEIAVEKFAHNLKHDESRKPIPWFIEENIDLPWADEHKNEREDILWGILRLYADSKTDAITTKLPDVVSSYNTTGNPVDVRFSFQLYQILGTQFPTITDSSKADELALDFAAQLDSAGEWTWAVFALLHLSDHKQRQKALRSLLAQHASELHDRDSRPFRTLVDEFKIPESWIWEAKALYCRSVEGDNIKEVEYLLQAKLWEEAHMTLCRVVAPRAIIEQEYGMLQQLISSFTGKDQVHGWALGGQVYEDYVRLQKGLRDGEKSEVLKRLLGALPAMVKDRPGRLGFTEMVAVHEMSAVVGNVVLEDREKSIEAARVLHLPLTEDVHLKHTVDLSLQYYQAVMAGGK